MTSNERRDLFLLYAAGQLEPAEVEKLRADIASGDPQSAAWLAEAEATLNSLAMTLEPIAPPAQARDRLMQRVLAGSSLPAASDAGGEAGVVRASSSPVASVGTTRRVGWVWPMLGGLAAGVALLVWVSTEQNNRWNHKLSVVQDELAGARQRLTEMDQQLSSVSRDAASVRALLDTQNLALVSLPAAQPGQPNGRILYDVANRTWHVRVFDLKPLPKNKTYELWFITPDEQKIPAGTFDVDPDGSGSIMVSVPDNLEVALAAITDEPVGGSPQPTGTIQLAGQVSVR